MTNKTKILDVEVSTLKQDEVLDQIRGYLSGNSPHIVATVNSEFVIRAQSDDKFKTILNDKSSINLPDSFGILWASWFENLPAPRGIIQKILLFFNWAASLLLVPITPKRYMSTIPEKISGSDFIWTLSKMCAQYHHKAFLFGGEPTVAQRCALRLQTEVEGFRVAGVAEGVPLPDNDQVIEAIKKSNADILFIAIGAPAQEKWLSENLSKTGCKVGIGLGGTFDFVAGSKKRAPLWMQKSGLEWIYRLVQEPSRIKRQIALPKLAWLLLMKKFLHKRSLD